MDEVRPRISGAYGFAFLYQGDRYYFAPEHFKQDERDCYLYLGFKNEQLSYAFPKEVFYTISKTYADNSKPDVIKKLIVQDVAKYPHSSRVCYDLGKEVKFDHRQADVYFYMLVLLPVTLALATYAVVDDQGEKSLLAKVAEELPLGMELRKTPFWVRERWTQKTKGDVSYYEFTKGHLQMLLYFENGKLDAWSQIRVEKKSLFQ